MSFGLAALPPMNKGASFGPRPTLDFGTQPNATTNMADAMKSLQSQMSLAPSLNVSNRLSELRAESPLAQRVLGLGFAPNVQTPVTIPLQAASLLDIKKKLEAGLSEQAKALEPRIANQEITDQFYLGQRSKFDTDSQTNRKLYEDPYAHLVSTRDNPLMEIRDTSMDYRDNFKYVPSQVLPYSELMDQYEPYTQDEGMGSTIRYIYKKKGAFVGDSERPPDEGALVVVAPFYRPVVPRKLDIPINESQLT